MTVASTACPPLYSHVWGQCDPPLPNLSANLPSYRQHRIPQVTQRTFLRGDGPSPATGLIFGILARMSSSLDPSVAWEGTESWTEAGSYREAAAVPSDSSAELWSSAEAPAPLQCTERRLGLCQKEHRA
ncbi:hypothetical protein I79_010400 [Cricetulus griseus]|uniref:Uncharacterized protein n=1 Tax=Cricetulus griseus TaxID=10029 RepID=G3HID9_CRIGR|nr:hypothetical protein I79_010400 [Cricetulus griseus]